MMTAFKPLAMAQDLLLTRGLPHAWHMFPGSSPSLTITQDPERAMIMRNVVVATVTGLLLFVVAHVEVRADDEAAKAVVKAFFEDHRVRILNEDGKIVVQLPGGSLVEQCEALRDLHARVLRASPQTPLLDFTIENQGTKWVVCVGIGLDGANPGDEGGGVTALLTDGRPPNTIALALAGNGSDSAAVGQSGGNGGRAQAINPNQLGIAIASGGNGGRGTTDSKGGDGGAAVATVANTNSATLACGGTGGDAAPLATPEAQPLEGGKGGDAIAELTRTDPTRGSAVAIGGKGGTGGQGLSAALARPKIGGGSGEAGPGAKGGNGGMAEAKIANALEQTEVRAQGGTGGKGGKGGTGSPTLPGARGGPGGTSGDTILQSAGHTFGHNIRGGEGGDGGEGNPPGDGGEGGEGGTLIVNGADQEVRVEGSIGRPGTRLR
jgi:hypothetical protein